MAKVERRRVRVNGSAAMHTLVRVDDNTKKANWQITQPGLPADNPIPPNLQYNREHGLDLPVPSF